jgi:hypothetical protein
MGWASGVLRQEVVPGGNGFSYAGQSLAEQGHEQFSIEPRATALIVVLGNVSDLRDGLETLEGQFDLPAEPVGFKYLLDACFGVGQGCENKNALSRTSKGVNCYLSACGGLLPRLARECACIFSIARLR